MACVGGASVGEAGWALRRAPSPDDTVVELLVVERACASGRPADDRIEVDVVERVCRLDDTLTARPIDG